MKISDIFTDYLDTCAELTAVNGLQGVFSEILPQGRQNGIVYTSLAGKPNYHLSGRSTLEKCSYSFTTYAKTDSKAYEIYEQLKKALEAMDGIYNGVNIQSVECIMEGQSDFETGTKYFSYTSDYTFQFNR
jgi:hypothetical protein